MGIFQFATRKANSAKRIVKNDVSKRRQLRRLIQFQPQVERLEQRMLMAADLIGFSRVQVINGTIWSNPNATFGVSPQPVSFGELATVSLYVANIGNAASAAFQVGVYFSTDASIDTSDTLMGNVNFPAITTASPVVGGTVQMSLPTSRPTGPFGNYFIGMIIDVGNVVPEDSETNNRNQGGGRDLVGVTVLPSVANVADTIGSSTDKAMNFGSIVNDGPRNASVSYSVTLSDSAAKSILKVGQNGVRLASGTNFKIDSILSNKLSQAVNVAGGSSLIAANSSETWTIQISFDPIANGSLTDTLIIETDDPVNPTINVALSGIGTPQGNLSISDSVAPANDQKVDLGDVAVDGVGGLFKTATLTLVNNGSGPITINQNGINVPAGQFSILSIISNTQGAINLATGAKTLAAASAETWTVTVKFDPNATGLVQQALTVLSSDPDSPSSTVTLIGTGLTPPKVVVTDSVLPDNDLVVAFGSVHADGANRQLARQTLTLKNSGQMPLIVNQNGLTFLTGTQYRIESVTSSFAGDVSLATGTATIAPNSTETWTVKLLFDPALFGTLTDTLRISSNDLVAPTTSISLTGTGLDQPALLVTDTTPPPNDNAQEFPATLNDGTGGKKNTRTLQLSNVGNQNLSVNQNGITLLTGTNFRVASIVSSTAGAINLATGAKTLLARSAEIWTVALEFDPTATGTLTDTLRIASNDPLLPTTSIALSGVGAVPQVTTTSPSRVLHASAGSVYSIDWVGLFGPGNGVYSVYYDTDLNPASGLVPIATDLPQGTSSYRWHVPTSLVGGTFTIYVTMNEAGFPGVKAGDYADGSIIVDANGTDRLLSTPVTDATTYTLTTRVNGTDVNTTEALVLGPNILYQTVAGATREYRITRVATLVDADHTDYDELGNVTATTDSDGRKTVYKYDLLSRLTWVEYPDGSNVDYTYDVAGNLLSMRDSTGWQLYTYDTRDRLTSVTYSPTSSPTDPAALRIGYEYDLTDRLSALIYPSGKRVEYGYTTAGKLNRVTEKNAGQADLVSTYTYSSTTGLLSKMTRPNDTETTYGYDANGRLNDIHHKRTSTQATVLRYAYSLDASGRRTGVVVTSTTGVRAEKYVYDDLNRLSEVTYSDDNGTIDATDRIVRYGYDKNGNRLTQTTFANGVSAGATETLTYAYGFENRLLTVTDQNGIVQQRFAYDHKGNQTQKVTPVKAITYSYNDRNLLIDVSDGTNFVEYFYDGAGRRIGQTTNGVFTRTVVDPSNPIFQTLEERDSVGSLALSNVYGSERLSTISTGSTRSFYLQDALGSVGQLSLADGSSLSQQRYEVFGSLRSSPSEQTKYGFAGEPLDPVANLTYLRARDYDAQNGRLIQKDPIQLRNQTTLFSYASADPVNNIDPSGRILLGSENYAYPSMTGIPGGDDRGVMQLLIDNAADLLTPGRGLLSQIESAITGDPLPFMLGGVGAGRNAIGFQVQGKDLAQTISFIKSQNFPTSYEAAQIAFAKHDFEVATSGSNFSDLTNPKIIDAHWNLAKNSPDLGIKAVFGTLAGIGAVGNFVGNAVTSVGNAISSAFSGITNAVGNLFGAKPGGVLLDKAASLIGANLDDIAGASFDPVTGQLVFLGSQNPGTLSNVDLDLFATAIQSVFGSAVPPYVTLDPPAKLIQSSFNLGDGDGVILNGKTASVPIKYTPFSATEVDDMTLTFKINGQLQTVRLNGWVMNGQGGLTLSAGGRFGEGLTLAGGVSNGLGQATLASAVSGVSYIMPALGVDLLKPQFNAGSITINAGNSINLGSIGGGGYTLFLTGQAQDSSWSFSIKNSSGSTQTISEVQLVPDRQHRKFGGRVDNTRLGWIIEEADRVMKALGIGKDHLTGASYNSSTPGMPPGYQNQLERYRDAGTTGSFNNRFWFTPNEQTLKRFIDPVTGQATVVFDRATVKLNTEALVLGQPEDIVARNWADYFNANYDAFANKEFPVYDPADPTNTNIINVKIFDELRNAMKAVSLARFFKDNSIPLDTWWLNSYQSPVSYTPLTIPTLTNSLQNGSVTLTMYGGVTIKTPNSYIPDVVAQSIANAVRNQRPAGSGDLAGQTWNVTSGTSYGGLKAVATTLDDRKQDANITLSATDLSFPSAGGRQLAFNRFYNSGYLVDDNLGRGWRPVQYDLQFQLPSYVDDAGLMRDSTGARLSVTGADSDTRLRSGEIRIYDQGSGALLSFNSSLTARYDLDSQQNPIFVISGLGTNKVPSFTASTYRDGSTLTQDPSTFNYTLTRTDGSKLVFNSSGKLIQDIDSRGFTFTYSYTTAGKLSQIADATNQAIRVNYATSGRIDSVIAPEPTGNAQRKAQYIYDAGGRLIRVDIQALQTNATYLTARDTKYEYNSDNQLTGITGPDGVKTLTAAVDLTGRQDMSQDQLGNMADLSFTVDTITGDRTTQTLDMGTTGVNNATAHGLDAIKYFASGSTSSQKFDSTARTTKSVDAMGHETKLGYTGDLQAPTSITLPTANRPSISIQRNIFSLPTVINDPANLGATPTQITYTAANKPDTVTDSKGRVTKYTYTAWNDIATLTVAFGTPLAATTTYNYNARKLLDNVVDPLARVVQRYGYDAFDRVTSTTDADGILTTVTYDTLGRVKRVFDPRLTGTVRFTEYFYNDNDQVTRIATPTGDITNVYDATTKRLISTTDLTGNTTLFGYNAAGQLISESQVSTGGNAVTQYEFGRRGEMVALIAPEGHRTSFRTDVLGRPTDVIEDNNLAPLATSVAIVDKTTTSMDVQVIAQEPILVGTIKYWQDGQSATTGITRDLRLADQTQFVFNLTGIDQTKAYRYELTLTDRVGRSQTLPQSVLPALVTLNPEIVVLSGAANVVDGSSLNMGTATLNSAALTKTFTVQNSGNFALKLQPIAVSGAGYSLISPNFSVSQILPPGASVSFVIQLATTTLGTANGAVSFANDDADENPFNFNLSGSIVVNQAPTDIVLSNNSLAENQAAGTIVGVFSSVDPDAGNSFTYSLVAGTGSADNSSFTIDAAGNLNSAVSFDFETKSSYSIRVRTVDQGGLSFEKQFTITITDVNESPVLTRSLASIIGNVLTTLSNTGTWSDPESGIVTLTSSLGNVIKNANGTWDWSFTPATIFNSQTVTITASDGTNTATTTFVINALVAIPNRQVFYKNSGFTGVPAALDSSKVLLRSTTTTQVTSFANVINYSRGINGLVLDVAGLAAASLSASDFIFRVAPAGASGTVDPNTWLAAPTPTLIDVTPGNATTAARVRLEWADEAIMNTWLQIIVKANANTGLINREVFYIGHAYGEVDGVAPYRLTTIDVGLVRAAVGNAIVSVNDVRDFDKDRRITTTDVGLMRARVNNNVLLNNITIPAAGSSGEGEGRFAPFGNSDLFAPPIPIGSSDKLLGGNDSLGRSESATLQPRILPRWTGLDYSVAMANWHTDPMAKRLEVAALQMVETIETEPATSQIGLIDAFFTKLEKKRLKVCSFDSPFEV